jgi:hypothetical protein
MAAEQSASPHRIVVVPGPFGFEVQPPVLLTDTGDASLIRNMTSHPVFVEFPSEIVQGGLQLSLAPKGNAGETQQFTITGSVPGIYEYVVDVALAAGATIRARGSSNPRIIIH